MNDSKKENQGFKLINWKLIAIGCIIFFICWIIAFGLTFSVPFFLLFPSLVKLYPILLNIALVILFLSPLIAGFTVAYINNIPEYKSGIINGVIGIIIGFILFNLLSELMGVIRGTPYSNINFIIFSRILILIGLSILGILGAFIGTRLKKN